MTIIACVYDVHGTQTAVYPELTHINSRFLNYWL